MESPTSNIAPWSASLAKNLSFQTYLDDSYAKEPAPGRLKNDAKLVSAISYKF